MSAAAIDYRLPDGPANTILGDIVRAKLRELTGNKRLWPADSIRTGLEHAGEVRSFKRALLRHSPAIIAEVKQASPSAGLIRANFDALEIAREYQASGAAAISVVTEAAHFHGNLETLARLRWQCGLPLLRKDFVIDPYQVLEARHAGADAVLLIVALLDPPLLTALRKEVEAHNMDALVEVHDEREMERALDAGASLIGVNNRNLKTFEVSLEVSLRLAARVPKECVAVVESGIRSAADIQKLSDAGYRGFLVGEHLLRAASPGAALAALFPVPAASRRRSS
jgi:indole-3-glycerol phosphate synthase